MAEHRETHSLSYPRTCNKVDNVTVFKTINASGVNTQKKAKNAQPWKRRFVSEEGLQGTVYQRSIKYKRCAGA